jgi:small subunit ribosomal protein S4
MKRSNLKSPYQARQIVVHGHVSIGNRKINLPGYLVKKDEEPQILVHLNPVAESQQQ